MFDRMYSGFYVWGIGTVVVLGLFLVFMQAGWPGHINNCVWGSDKQLPESALVAPPPHASAQAPKNYQLELKKIAADNTCYCEAFSVSDAAQGKPGVRQKQNTWFNLYAIFWIFSQTGKFMCSPTGPQPHGLLWHPLAGAMAVFVYFYWRCDTSDDVTAFA